MMTIDDATIDDLPALVDIYNHSVAASNSNFDTLPAMVEERRDWFDQFSTTGPHRLLVARSKTSVLGYACSSRYREHRAFRETVELSVSLHTTWRGQGFGTLLYSALFEQLSDQQIHVALAGIALPNDAGVALHRKFGFTEVGIFREYAIKHRDYISALWMQRILEHD